MPIDFPNSPTNGDTYSAGGKNWVYNGSAWTLQGVVPTIPNGSVGASQLATDAVTNAKIASGAVTEAKIADSSITTAKIAAGAVVEADIAANAVTQAKLASTLSAVTICTSSTRPGSPFIGQTIFETDTNKQKVWLGSSWSNGTVHSFGLPVEYLIVAGGGGGATDRDVGGGGGGGGLLTGSLTGLSALSPATYPITVGAGGARGTGPDETGVGGGSNGTQGGNSTFNSFTAIGGGFGGTRNQNGGSGGSGGGGGDNSNLGGSGTVGQGFAGGNGPGMNTQSGNDSGGGGGAGGAASLNNPGIGLFSAIGNATYSAGGRGAQLFAPFDSTINSGNGGVGARSGGSGVVVIRYLTADAGGTTITGGTKVVGPAHAPTYTVHTFTSSGSLVIA